MTATRRIHLQGGFDERWFEQRTDLLPTYARRFREAQAIKDEAARNRANMALLTDYIQETIVAHNFVGADGRPMPVGKNLPIALNRDEDGLWADLIETLGELWEDDAKALDLGKPSSGA